MILEGLDVSYFQDSPHWQQVRLDGYTFAAAKATEGLRVLDPQFPRNWQKMKERGLLRFAYHFFYDSLGPLLQLQRHHEYVRDSGHYEYGDAGMLDVEEYGISQGAAAVPLIEEFITGFWHDINKPLMLYTNYDTWFNLLGDPVSAIIGQCPLWLADYGPYVPGLRQWPHGLSFLQYSDSGHVPGIKEVCDLDRFYGNIRQLRRIMTTVPQHE